jgi:hypothetical protein
MADSLELRGVGCRTTPERVDEASVPAAMAMHRFDELIWVTRAVLACGHCRTDEGGHQDRCDLRARSAIPMPSQPATWLHVEHPAAAGVAVRQAAVGSQSAPARLLAKRPRLCQAQVPVTDLDGGPLRRRLARALGGSGATLAFR